MSLCIKAAIIEKRVTLFTVIWFKSRWKPRRKPIVVNYFLQNKTVFIKYTRYIGRYCSRKYVQRNHVMKIMIIMNVAIIIIMMVRDSSQATLLKRTTR